MEIKIVKKYAYRKARLNNHDIALPREALTELEKQLAELTDKARANHTLYLVESKPDGRIRRTAIYFHDSGIYFGREEDIVVVD